MVDLLTKVLNSHYNVSALHPCNDYAFLEYIMLKVLHALGRDISNMLKVKSEKNSPMSKAFAT